MKQIADNEKKLDDSTGAGQEQFTSEQRQLDDAQAQLKDATPRRRRQAHPPP